MVSYVIMRTCPASGGVSIDVVDVETGFIPRHAVMGRADRAAALLDREHIIAKFVAGKEWIQSPGPFSGLDHSDGAHSCWVRSAGVNASQQEPASTPQYDTPKLFQEQEPLPWVESTSLMARSLLFVGTTLVHYLWQSLRKKKP